MTDFSTMGFTGAPFDRASNKRTDQAWLEVSLSGDNARFMVFIDGRPVIDVGRAKLAIRWFARREIANGPRLQEAVLVNVDDEGNAVFAVDMPEGAVAESLTEKLIDLRSLAIQAVLPTDVLGMLAQARSVLNWHTRHRFCSNCGSPTRFTEGGYRRHCDECGADHFPRVDPVVIMMIRNEGRYLLGRGKGFAELRYSALAGFVEPGETLEDAVRREVLEETGVHVGDVTYMASQPWPFPSTMMIGMLGEATTTDISLDNNEIEDARWFSEDDIVLMMREKHPEGITLPPQMSIAWQMTDNLIRRSR